MRLKIAGLPGLMFLIPTLALQAQTPAAFRVLMGVTDTSSIRWDGTITVKEAGDYSLEGWRFEDMDDIDGNVFHFSTHEPRLPGGPLSKWKTGPVVANGFIVNAKAVSDGSEFMFTTAQGDFRFQA